MRIRNIILSLTLMVSCISCSKHRDGATEVQATNSDILTAISRDWQLYMFVIGTDKDYYYVTGSELKNQSLYELSFKRTETYIASDNLWSGIYHFTTDSTQLTLEPINPLQLTCGLNIDNISKTKMQFSTPWVEVNPEKAGASNYEKFIVYQAITYLYNHNQDISKLRSVKLQLRYGSK